MQRLCETMNLGFLHAPHSESLQALSPDLFLGAFGIGAPIAALERIAPVISMPIHAAGSTASRPPRRQAPSRRSHRLDHAATDVDREDDPAPASVISTASRLTSQLRLGNPSAHHRGASVRSA